MVLALTASSEWMPYTCYILRCADGCYYVGATVALRERMKLHQAGRVPSTRARRPVTLVYYEVHPSAAAAFARERSLKNGRTRKTTRERLIRLFPSAKLREFP